MGNTRKREVFQAGRGLAGYKAEEWAKVSMGMLKMSKRCGVLEAPEGDAAGEASRLLADHSGLL